MPEKTVKCPFNPKHVMLESALQRHIIKCMVNYPEYLACPYNALHRLKNKILLTEHILICPSKTEIDVMFNDWNLQKVIANAETPYHIDNVRDFNLAFEDWDADLKSG